MSACGARTSTSICSQSKSILLNDICIVTNLLEQLKIDWRSTSFTCTFRQEPQQTEKVPCQLLFLADWNWTTGPKPRATLHSLKESTYGIYERRSIIFISNQESGSLKKHSLWIGAIPTGWVERVDFTVHIERHLRYHPNDTQLMFINEWHTCWTQCSSGRSTSNDWSRLVMPVCTQKRAHLLESKKSKPQMAKPSQLYFLSGSH